ncbi:MAG: hypothetical protein JW395_2928 [Nitrospira sp.]|nr:hypothetical protein [Nitrospira sp.]
MLGAVRYTTPLVQRGATVLARSDSLANLLTSFVKSVMVGPIRPLARVALCSPVMRTLDSKWPITADSLAIRLAP